MHGDPQPEGFQPGDETVLELAGIPAVEVVMAEAGASARTRPDPGNGDLVAPRKRPTGRRG